MVLKYEGDSLTVLFDDVGEKNLAATGADRIDTDSHALNAHNHLLI